MNLKPSRCKRLHIHFQLQLYGLILTTLKLLELDNQSLFSSRILSKLFSKREEQSFQLSCMMDALPSLNALMLQSDLMHIWTHMESQLDPFTWMMESLLTTRMELMRTLPSLSTTTISLFMLKIPLMSLERLSMKSMSMVMEVLVLLQLLKEDTVLSGPSSLDISLSLSHQLQSRILILLWPWDVLKKRPLLLSDL